LTQLQSLYIGGAEITDAGMEHLRGMTWLRSLYLWNTHVTGDGMKELQKNLPNCTIHP